jgi:hypothetical protein
MEKINLSGDDLQGLPLFFWKIIYNEVSDMKEERKLLKYDSKCQAYLMSMKSSMREISKTVNYQVIKQMENENP